MVAILADFTDQTYVALIYDTDKGYGVIGCKRHTLWFGENSRMARDVYDLECNDASDPTFTPDEVPTC